MLIITTLMAYTDFFHSDTIAKTFSVQSLVKNIKCQQNCKTESMYTLFPKHCDRVQ